MGLVSPWPLKASHIPRGGGCPLYDPVTPVSGDDPHGLEVAGYGSSGLCVPHAAFLISEAVGELL